MQNIYIKIDLYNFNKKNSMEYLNVLKVFRKYYGKNQKYYSSIHPILYYNDEFFTNPLKKTDEEKEEIKDKLLDKYFENYKLGINRCNFFKLFLSILRKYNDNYSLNIEEVINQMIYDFDSKNLAREYRLKEFKITKTGMRNIIIDEKFNTEEFLQFCADYFAFKIILINEDEGKQFNPRNNMLSPKIFIYEGLDNRYYEIIINNKNWISDKDIEYNKYNFGSTNEEIDKRDVLVASEEEEDAKFDCSKLSKMKVKELQEIAEQLLISIQKINPRKTKMINKLKEELIADIINYSE